MPAPKSVPLFGAAEQLSVGLFARGFWNFLEPAWLLSILLLFPLLLFPLLL